MKKRRRQNPDGKEEKHEGQLDGGQVQSAQLFALKGGEYMASQWAFIPRC